MAREPEYCREIKGNKRVGQNKEALALLRKKLKWTCILIWWPLHHATYFLTFLKSLYAIGDQSVDVSFDVATGEFNRSLNISQTRA